jgi:anti-sigma factor RsiW
LSGGVSKEVKMKKSNIHKQIQEKMILYLDGDLDKAEAEKVRSHADRCPECARVLENCRRLWTQESFEEEAVPSQRLWNNIEARLDETRQPRAFFFKLDEWVHRFAFPVAMAVLISLAAAAGVVIGSSGGQPSAESIAGLNPSAAAADEEFKLGLFDISPPGSLTGIFGGRAESGPSQE